jgi:hypothetical protein
VRRKERPNFDEIVKRLQGDIGDEIKRKEEPMITIYSAEDDLVYRNRIGKEDEIEDSEGEEEGRGTKGGGGVSKAVFERLQAEHQHVVRLKDETVKELQKKLGAMEKKMEKLASPEKEAGKKP